MDNLGYFIFIIYNKIIKFMENLIKKIILKL